MNPLFVLFNLPEQYVTNLYLQQPMEVLINDKSGTALQGNITASMPRSTKAPAILSCKD